MPAVVTQGQTFDFTAVYTENLRFVWRLLRGMGLPDAVVADAAQDVFIVVHRRLPEFEGRHPITTWLFSITYRVACNYRRSLRRTREQEPLDDRLLDHRPNPAEAAERGDDQRLMAALLDELDDRKRAMVVLADFEGFTAPQIAALTETPLSTVYTLLRRAHAQLERALAARQKRLR